MAIQKLKNFHENEIENIKIGLEEMKMNRGTESKVISSNQLKFTLGLGKCYNSAECWFENEISN